MCSAGGCEGTHSVAEKSYPTSKVRGSGQECQAATAQERPGGATLRLVSGAAAGRSNPTSEVRGRSREDPMPEGRWPRGVTSCPRSGAAAESAKLRRAGAAERSYQVRGQGWRWTGATPCPRSSGSTGTGGPRGAIPRSRSGGAGVRRYTSSKIRSSREEIPHIQGKRNPNKTVGERASEGRYTESIITEN